MKNITTFSIKIYYKYLPLIFICLASFFFRFYNLEQLPGAFFGDEAALGYNGWSLLTTGKDEYGKKFPITMRSFDDDKPAVYSYLTIPFIALFGLNQATSRAPAALFGSLFPVFLYVLVLRQKNNRSLALWSALIASTTPWHIEISRTAIEAGVALSLATLSFVLFMSESNKKHMLGFFLLLLTLFTYHTARLIVPVLLIGGILLKVFKFSRSKIALSWVFFIFGVVLSFGASQARFSQISIFSDQEAKLLRDEAIREDGGPISVELLETRLMHNKPLSILQSFTKSYLSNSSLSYLFIGGAQPPRVTISEIGQFLVILLPFFALGIFATIKDWNKFDKWLIFWMLFAPVPASLTTAEIPHTYRTLFLLPPIIVLVAKGIELCLSWVSFFRKQVRFSLTAIILVLIGVNFTKFWHQYRVHQQVHQPWHRQYGYKALVSYLNSQDEVETVTITTRENEPYIFLLFYNKIDPKIYQSWPEKRLGHQEISNGAKDWKMFNYVFSEQPCTHDGDDHNSNNLYVVLPSCDVPPGFERVHKIDFLDGNPEFVIDRPIAIN